MSLAPLRRYVVVATTPDRAYRAWTEEIGSWWPLDRFSVHERDNTVAFEDDLIVERWDSGGQAVWGRVLEREPGRRLRFTWHPGRDEEDPQIVVDVSFTEVEGGTLVSLVHTGWESHPEPAAARERYAGGWVRVLDRLADAYPVA